MNCSYVEAGQSPEIAKALLKLRLSRAIWVDFLHLVVLLFLTEINCKLFSTISYKTISIGKTHGAKIL